MLYYSYLRIMKNVEGVEIEKNDKGEDAFIRIDLNRYGEQLRPFLEEIGALEFDFEKEWENSLTLEEAKLKSIEMMKKW